MDKFDISIHTNRPPLNSPEPSFDSKEADSTVLMDPEQPNICTDASEGEGRNGDGEEEEEEEDQDEDEEENGVQAIKKDEKTDIFILERVLKYLPINGKYGERTALWTRIAEEKNNSMELSSTRWMSFKSVRVRFYTLYKLFCKRLEISRAGKGFEFTDLNRIDKLLLQIHNKDQKNRHQNKEDESNSSKLPSGFTQDRSERASTFVDIPDNGSDYEMDLAQYRKAKLALMKENLKIKKQLLEWFKMEMKK